MERQQQASLVCVLLACWCTGHALGSVLAVGELQVCSATSVATDPDCVDKFMLALSVQNAQTMADSISVFSFDSAIGSSGQEYQIQDRVEIAIAKSPIVIEYPITYERDYNSKPQEAVTMSRDGYALDSVTNRCEDGLSSDPVCGFVVHNGQRVPYSEGFCCSCDAGGFFGLDNDVTRSNQDCVFSTTQSAHCLRMSALWYSAYSVMAPKVSYEITAQVTTCEAGQECTKELLQLSPASPVACLEDENGLCKLKLKLEGDFAAFESPMSLEHKYLFVPSVCDTPTLEGCLSRSMEDARRWMLIDKHHVTESGLECDKIGTSYEAFNTQASRCEVARSTCLANQLDDFYQADLQNDEDNTVGDYFLKFLASNGGEFQYVGNSAAEPRLHYETTRFQKSVLTLELAADSVQYNINASPGEIRSVQVSPFAALSKSGLLVAHILNIGSLTAQFHVSVECTPGINSVAAQEVSLEPAPADGSEKELMFNLVAQHWDARRHDCVVLVKDALLRLTDSVHTNFTVMQAEIDRDTQAGSLNEEGQAVVATDDDAAATIPYEEVVSCSQLCPNMFSVWCAVMHSCLTRQLILLGCILALLLWCCCALKYPKVLCCPCRMLLCRHKHRSASRQGAVEIVHRMQPVLGSHPSFIPQPTQQQMGKHTHHCKPPGQVHSRSRRSRDSYNELSAPGGNDLHPGFYQERRLHDDHVGRGYARDSGPAYGGNEAARHHLQNLRDDGQHRRAVITPHHTDNSHQQPGSHQRRYRREVEPRGCNRASLNRHATQPEPITNQQHVV